MNVDADDPGFDPRKELYRIEQSMDWLADQLRDWMDEGADSGELSAVQRSWIIAHMGGKLVEYRIVLDRSVFTQSSSVNLSQLSF